jgi:hypothetical protein
MYKIESLRTGYRQEFGSMVEVKEALKESYTIFGSDLPGEFIVLDENDRELKLSLEIKVVIGDWHYLTV